MGTSRRQRFVTEQIALMLAAVLGLALLDSLTLALFFVASLVGFLLLTVGTGPVNLTPRWRSRLKWPLLAGVILFAYLILREVLTVSRTLF